MVQNNSARRRRQWRTGLEKKQGGEEVLNQSDLTGLSILGSDFDYFPKPGSRICP